MDSENLSSSSILSIGSPAPELIVLDQDANTFSLGDIYARGVTLVYFYPKAATPGCTAEACSLRDSYTTFRDRGGNPIQILGVSCDKPEAQKKFQHRQNLPFTLIADQEGSLAKAFGVKRNLFGMPQRQSFLIKNSKIAWSTLKAQTHTADEEIQAALKSL